MAEPTAADVGLVAALLIQDSGGVTSHIAHDVRGGADVVDESDRLADQRGDDIEVLCGDPGVRVIALRGRPGEPRRPGVPAARNAVLRRFVEAAVASAGTADA